MIVQNYIIITIMLSPLSFFYKQICNIYHINHILYTCLTHIFIHEYIIHVYLLIMG